MDTNHATPADRARIHAVLDEGVPHPLADHDGHHDGDDVGQPSRQLKHDDHQGDYRGVYRLDIIMLKIFAIIILHVFSNFIAIIATSFLILFSSLTI